jgi:hypothetical protein
MKLRESMMIPLKKEMTAWWYGDIEKGETYLEKQTLPEGTPCGNFKIILEDESHSIVQFTAMVKSGIFNRYRVLIVKEQ